MKEKNLPFNYMRAVVKNELYEWKKLLLSYKSKFEYDENKPLTEEILIDASNPITKNLLYIYTMESPIYQKLNSACRNRDESQIMILGPYARAL